MSAPARPRILLVGCGEIAMLAHLPALAVLHAEGVLELAGVCDLDAAKAREAARRFLVPASGGDWRELARQTGAHALSVCLPPGANADVSTAAVAEGLHALCEKPPGRDVPQAAAMAAAAAARPDLVTMVAFNRRYAPLYRKARARSETIGRPHAFTARFTRAAIGQDPSNTVSDWISSDGSHALDLALATMGAPDRLAVSRRKVGAGPDNAWVVQLSGENGTATLWLDFAAGRRLERFEWTGPGYDVALELPDRGEWAQRGSVESWSAPALTGRADYFVNYGFLDEYRAFADAISGRAPRPENDFAYGERFLRLVETILATEDGGWLRLDATTDTAAKAAPRAALASAPVARRPVLAILQPPDSVRRYFPPELMAEVSRRCDVRFSRGGDPGELLRGAEAVVLGWGAPALDARSVAGAPGLRLAVVLGASVRWAIPQGTLNGHTAVCNTADAIAQSVAEHCLMLALAGLRRLPQVDRAMRRGAWPPQPARGRGLRRLASRAARLPGLSALKSALRPAAERVLSAVSGPTEGAAWSDLRGQTVGLIGWGHIARRFAELLAPFSCRILVASEHTSDEELERYGARRASLGEVVASSRIVSLHKGLTDRSRGVLSRDLIALLPKGAVLINTARAGLVDEEALLERARRGDIVVGLDVFAEEPLPKSHPLRRLENVILSPHNASATPQCARRVGEQALSIVLDWTAGKDVAALDLARLGSMT